MANGVYGTVVSSRITANDVDIFYCYHETRNSDNVDNAIFKKISSNILVQSLCEQDTDTVDNILEGMYNLKLPLTYFNKKGFYTVYIKPKEIPVTILDVGVLSAYPDVKGIVVDTSSISDNNLRVKFQSNNDLVGYRIEYFDDNGERQDYYRLVTSNNKCEPVIQNLSDSNQKAVRYRYNESSTLTFITVTPSSSPTFKPNATPYIGKPTQKAVFINTKFTPIMLDIEMVDHDIDTLSNMLEGSQLRDLDNGLVTTFNSDNEIYHQAEHYTLKDEFTGVPVYEVKKNKQNSIDFSQDINTIINEE
jgi:hypothetical protein